MSRREDPPRAVLDPPRRSSTLAGPKNHREAEPMPHRTRIALAAAVVALTAGLAAVQGAQAQTARQRCTPSIKGHTRIARLPGITIAAQTCVIRFGPVDREKAWVHTVWKRSSFQTRFSIFTISSRLELRDVVDRSKSLRCRLPSLVNTQRSGPFTCETLLETSQAHAWTGDGSVGYKVPRHRSRVHQLKGSPKV